MFLFKMRHYSCLAQIFFFQTNCSDLEEMMQSPYIELLKQRGSENRRASANIPVDNDAPRNCDNNAKLAMRDDQKENFLIPHTPLTPKSKRPPTYGMSPPTSQPRRDGESLTTPSNTQPKSPPPMSGVLASNMDRGNACWQFPIYLILSTAQIFQNPMPWKWKFRA